MITEEQLNEWEQSSKFKSNMGININPVIVMLLIDEIRTLNKIIEYLAYTVSNTTNCTHRFTDCEKDKAPTEDCAKCWINKATYEVNNENFV